MYSSCCNVLSVGVLVVTLLYVHLTAAQTQPANVARVVGSSITLRCSAGSPLVFAQWLLYPNETTTSLTTIISGSCANPTLVPGYSVNGTNTASGQCDLIISSVVVNQAGWYQCGLTGNSGSVSYASQVTVLYSDPKLTQNVTSNVSVGDTVSMQCTVNYSSNGMNATMFWSGCSFATASYNTTVSGSMTTTQSEIYTVAQQQEYLQTCSCNTTTGSRPDPPGVVTGTPSTMLIPYSNVSQSEGGIRVQYCPYNVTIKPDNPFQPPGADITCSANGYPAPNYILTVQGPDGNLTQTDGSAVTLTVEGDYNATCIATVHISSGQQGSFSCSNQSMAIYYVNSSNAGTTQQPDKQVTLPCLFCAPCVSAECIGAAVGIAIAVAVVIAGVIALIVCFCHPSCLFNKKGYCRANRRVSTPSNKSHVTNDAQTGRRSDEPIQMDQVWTQPFQPDVTRYSNHSNHDDYPPYQQGYPAQLGYNNPVVSPDVVYADLGPRPQVDNRPGSRKPVQNLAIDNNVYAVVKSA